MPEALSDRFRRLLLLVPFVVARPGVSVKEVCCRFEITRGQLVADLNLLFMCGLPGYGPGDLIEAYVDGEEVWIRMADYFSRPLRLTPAEGLLLYAGAKALAAAGVADDALGRAVERLESTLGSQALSGVSVGLDEAEGLATVREALGQRLRLRIIYHARSKDEVTEREVDPWALFVSGGRWYLAGWCHRVQDERIFRLDRMRSVSMVQAPADIPDDLELSRYATPYIGSESATRVTLDLSPEAAWVADQYPIISTEPLDDAWTRVALTADGMAWLEHLMLRLGTQARVVEPEELREGVRTLACRLAERYR